MKHCFCSTGLALIVLFSALSHAEEVRIPVGQDTATWRGDTPRRGITKTQVEAKFGSPDTRHGPNGEPPIYYWEYPDFTVYFESDHVLHSVVKRRASGS